MKGERNLVIKNWYGFQVMCKLFEQGRSNMTAPSKQEYCLRKDRYGKERPNYERLYCRKKVCPILNGKIKIAEQQKDCVIIKEHNP